MKEVNHEMLESIGIKDSSIKKWGEETIVTATAERALDKINPIAIMSLICDLSNMNDEYSRNSRTFKPFELGISKEILEKMGAVTPLQFLQFRLEQKSKEAEKNR